MALIKPLPANGGGDPAYTNVYGHRSVQYDAKRAVITLGQYQDRAARESGSQPIQRDVQVNLTDEEVGLYRRVDYEVIKRVGTIGGLDLTDADGHYTPDDPNIASLITGLSNWEVKALLARVEMEMTTRELTPLTEAEIGALYGE